MRLRALAGYTVWASLIWLLKSIAELNNAIDDAFHGGSDSHGSTRTSSQHGLVDEMSAATGDWPCVPTVNPTFHSSSNSQGAQHERS